MQGIQKKKSNNMIIETYNRKRVSDTLLLVDVKLGKDDILIRHRLPRSLTKSSWVHHQILSKRRSTRCIFFSFYALLIPCLILLQTCKFSVWFISLWDTLRLLILSTYRPHYSKRKTKLFKKYRSWWRPSTVETSTKSPQRVPKKCNKMIIKALRLQKKSFRYTMQVYLHYN